MSEEPKTTPMDKLLASLETLGPKVQRLDQVVEAMIAGGRSAAMEGILQEAFVREKPWFIDQSLRRLAPNPDPPPLPTMVDWAKSDRPSQTVAWAKSNKPSQTVATAKYKTSYINLNNIEENDLSQQIKQIGRRVTGLRDLELQQLVVEAKPVDKQDLELHHLILAVRELVQDLMAQGFQQAFLQKHFRQGPQLISLTGSFSLTKKILCQKHFGILKEIEAHKDLYLRKQRKWDKALRKERAAWRRERRRAARLRKHPHVYTKAEIKRFKQHPRASRKSQFRKGRH